MTDGRATPLGAPVVVRSRRPDGLDAAYAVQEDEPVLAGHFPGFAIFPGVCLVECAHQSCLEALPGGAVLAAISSARFLAPVFPGDEVLVSVDVAEHEGGWECAARLSARRGQDGGEFEAALVKLRYGMAEDARGHR